MEVWLCAICSAALTVSLLDVENGVKCSTLDDSLHPKLQRKLKECWHAVEQGV